MTANYWESSQALQWKLTQEELEENRKEDLKYITEREYWHLTYYCCNVAFKIGRTMQLRQRIIATALTYFKRFYARNSYRGSEPLLVLTTCIYVATKIEEYPLHIKNVVDEAKNVIGEKLFKFDCANVAEFEFYLMEEMDFYLIVHHSYRTLTKLMLDLKLPVSSIQQAWWITNDIYRTDIPLLYPPHIIAVTIIFIVGVLIPDANKYKDKIKEWFIGLNVDMNEIVELSQEIINFYELWTDYSDRNIYGILKKLRASSSSDNNNNSNKIATDKKK
ncbi:G1/S-specific cyclin-C [Anaeromyces robustus]|uniref:G1/S-specific cyclin-C n=1 Tax=Anaeromyces robustus TaxID=1754192 RepID=A0A1Y1X7V1_9FUNG|nr:G1/S-specific cyclin-C [Anaeromyces robustus]|eukprot:ORX81798.1 G1/S-specific cyclin-C [Anaeromyces robustus]